MLPLYCCEAEVVLLDDGRIQRVEIEEQDDVVVESSLWIEDKTTTVLRLLSLSLDWLAFILVVISELNFFQFFCVHILLIRTKILFSSELVEKEHLVSLCSGILKRPEPKVASNSRQLLGQRQNIKMLHQSECEIGVCLGVLDQLQESDGRQVEIREHVVIEFLPCCLELLVCQIGKIIICFPEQFL